MTDKPPEPFRKPHPTPTNALPRKVSGTFRAAPPQQPHAPPPPAAPSQPPQPPTPLTRTGRFPVLPPDLVGKQQSPGSMAELDARIWPRVVEAFRRAEASLVQQVATQIEARLAERFAQVEVREQRIEKKLADLGNLAEQLKLLELELGALKPAASGMGSTDANALINSAEFQELLHKRFRTQTERMVQYLQQEIAKLKEG